MSNLDQQLIGELVDSSEQRFHDALAKISRDKRYQVEAGGHFIVAVAKELDRRADLPALRQAERLAAILSKVNLDLTGMDVISVHAWSLPAHLSNTISSHLSPSQRKRLYRRKEEIDKDSISSDLRSEVPQHDSVIVSLPTNELDPTEPCSTVLLLSHILNQETNKSLLKGAKFGPIQLDSIEKLHTELNTSTDICAILIDGSFLKALDKDEQTSLFKELGIYSTFIWLRIDRSGLKVSDIDVRKHLQTERCRREKTSAEEVSIQSDGILKQAELEEISRACYLLRTRDGAKFIPAEMLDDETRVLTSAMREHAQELRYDGDLKVLSVETKFLSGGASGAKIALVGVNREGKYAVAKINKKEALRDEMRRFLNFIQKWDDRLRPKPFFHGDAGVILFSLVPDETNICEPAPMLEQCLKALWDEEIFHIWNDQERLLETSNLCQGLKNITHSIAQLNKERPTNAEFPCLSNPSMKYIQKMEQRQVTWKFCSQAIQARDLAEQQFEKLAESAVVHGDLHLGNILVRGGRDMLLIDYAGSGPGHPAIDLVRLELALYLGWFMQTQEEDRYVLFQRMLSLNSDDTATLERFFGDSYVPAVNKVCIRGCAAARDRALETVKVHGGTRRDYLAAKYLVAWQSLLMQGRQTSLIRSVINALAPVIASW